jgi:hypothetical protein
MIISKIETKKIEYRRAIFIIIGTMTTDLNKGRSGVAEGAKLVRDGFLTVAFGFISITNGICDIGLGLSAKSEFLQLDEPKPPSHPLHEHEDPENGFVIVSERAVELQTTSASEKGLCIHITNSGDKFDSVAIFTTTSKPGIFEHYCLADEDGLP